MTQGRKTGGKLKGCKNYKTRMVEETIARMKFDPIECLIHFAKGDWKALGYEAECYFIEKPDGAVKMGYVITQEMRLDAAKTICKYVHAQKQAVAVSGELKGIEVIVKDYTKANE